MSDALLNLKDVTVTYPGRPSLQFAARQLGVAEQVALVGPSGSGKSTLLQLLAGLQRPTKGSVVLLGEPLQALGEAARDRLRGEAIGMVFQRLHLLPALNVLDNLRLARHCARLPPDDAHLRRLLAALDLSALAAARPGALSGGQQQRVAIARAWANRPRLVLADEPTASLDDANAARVLDLLRHQAADTGAALIVATHDPRVRARFDQVWDLAA